MNPFETLIYYLSFPFVRYAFIAVILISLCAGLLGVVLVLKRYALIGDGLSHVAFGAMAVAAVLGFAPMVVAIPVTVAVAVLLLLA
jgi:zinc transport system permease protein